MAMHHPDCPFSGAPRPAPTHSHAAPLYVLPLELEYGDVTVRSDGRPTRIVGVHRVEWPYGSRSPRPTFTVVNVVDVAPAPGTRRAVPDTLRIGGPFALVPLLARGRENRDDAEVAYLAGQINRGCRT